MPGKPIPTLGRDMWTCPGIVERERKEQPNLVTDDACNPLAAAAGKC